MNTELHDKDPEIEKREMKLHQVVINRNGIFAGKTLRDSGIRDVYNCMVVGLEEGKENLSQMDPSHKLRHGGYLDCRRAGRHRALLQGQRPCV